MNLQLLTAIAVGIDNFSERKFGQEVLHPKFFANTLPIYGVTTSVAGTIVLTY